MAGQSVQFLFGDLFKDYTELTAEVLSSSCFINDKSGNFKRSDLPEELQFAPIFSFATFPGTQGNTYLASGNFYGVCPMKEDMMQ